MPSVMVAGLYWEWMVRRGRDDGRKLAKDYLEIRFEDLVTEPRATLAKLGGFIDHDLDYDRIQQVGIGSVSEPNTSFKANDGNFNPVGRWKQGFSPQSLEMFEGLVGETLKELEYPLATDAMRLDDARLKRMRSLYRQYFNCKLYLKAKTPLGKLFVTHDLSWL